MELLASVINMHCILLRRIFGKYSIAVFFSLQGDFHLVILQNPLHYTRERERERERRERERERERGSLSYSQF